MASRERLSHHQTDGQEQGEDEHVSRGLPQNGVELPSAADGCHPAPREHVEGHIEGRQNEGPRAALRQEAGAQRPGRQARQQVQITAEGLSQQGNQGSLAVAAVGVAVAIVVDHEERINQILSKIKKTGILYEKVPSR